MRRGLQLLALVAVATAEAWWQFARGTAVTTVNAQAGPGSRNRYATGTVEPVRWAKERHQRIRSRARRGGEV
jgi:hypothetical protein